MINENACAIEGDVSQRLSEPSSVSTFAQIVKSLGETSPERKICTKECIQFVTFLVHSSGRYKRHQFEHH